MNAKDKVDIAIQAGLVARSVLQLMAVNSKTLATLMMNETIKYLTNLDKKVKSLPED